jgi:hypothetical protein
LTPPVDDASLPTTRRDIKKKNKKTKKKEKRRAKIKLYHSLLFAAPKKSAT